MSLTEHGLFCRVWAEGERRSAMAASIHEEEGGGPMGELEVGSVRDYRRRVDGGMVDVPGISGSRVRISDVAVPVVGDLVVVHHMYPGQIVRDGRPVRGIVHLAILASVRLRIAAQPSRNVNVDEIAKEKHK